MRVGGSALHWGSWGSEGTGACRGGRAVCVRAFAPTSSSGSLGGHGRGTSAGTWLFTPQDIRIPSPLQKTQKLWTLQSEWSKSLQTINADKCWRECGEKGTLLHCWWECKLVQPLWRTVWRFLKKLEIEVPYDPAIPLLGIHTKETRIERDTCTPVFIKTLFTIARTWKQPICPSADEWIRKQCTHV